MKFLARIPASVSYTHLDVYKRQVYVNPVLPPAAAPGECLLRVSCMATHTEALLDEAMDIIAEVLGKDEHV